MENFNEIEGMIIIATIIPSIIAFYMYIFSSYKYIKFALASESLSIIKAFFSVLTITVILYLLQQVLGFTPEHQLFATTEIILSLCTLAIAMLFKYFTNKEINKVNKSRQRMASPPAD